MEIALVISNVIVVLSVIPFNIAIYVGLFKKFKSYSKGGKK